MWPYPPPPSMKHSVNSTIYFNDLRWQRNDLSSYLIMFMTDIHCSTAAKGSHSCNEPPRACFMLHPMFYACGSLRCCPMSARSAKTSDDLETTQSLGRLGCKDQNTSGNNISEVREYDSEISINLFILFFTATKLYFISSFYFFKKN